jgi:hypothetical protein
MEHDLMAQIEAHDRKLNALRFEITLLKASYSNTPTEQRELAELLSEIESYTSEMIAFYAQLERFVGSA